MRQTKALQAGRDLFYAQQRDLKKEIFKNHSRNRSWHLGKTDVFFKPSGKGARRCIIAGISFNAFIGCEEMTSVEIRKALSEKNECSSIFIMK